MNYIIKNATALWPRCDKPYVYSDAERRSVPAKFNEPNAAYELSVEIADTEFKELKSAAQNAWKDFSAQKGIKGAPKTLPWKESEHGHAVKTKIKSCFDGVTPVDPPAHYDKDNVKMAPGYQLTHGSDVEVAIQFVPYSMNGGGVSLRLRAIRVLNEAEKAQGNPFGDGPAEFGSKPSGIAAMAADKAKADAPKPVLDEQPEDDIPW